MAATRIKLTAEQRARDTSTPPDELTRLTQAREAAVRHAALANGSTPIDAVAAAMRVDYYQGKVKDLHEDDWVAASSNPAWTLELVKDTGLLSKTNLRYQIERFFENWVRRRFEYLADSSEEIPMHYSEILCRFLLEGNRSDRWYERFFRFRLRKERVDSYRATIDAMWHMIEATADDFGPNDAVAWMTRLYLNLVYAHESHHGAPYHFYSPTIENIAGWFGISTPRQRAAAFFRRAYDRREDEEALKTEAAVLKKVAKKMKKEDAEAYVEAARVGRFHQTHPFLFNVLEAFSSRRDELENYPRLVFHIGRYLRPERDEADRILDEKLAPYRPRTDL